MYRNLLGAFLDSGIAYDTDAQAFFTASGITDLTQKSAVNQLVLDLKSASIWTKFKTIYPFVGGDATKHSYNLADPSNYQLTFSSGWTHSSNGVIGNGTSAYANTSFIPRGKLSINDSHISIYSKTNIISGNQIDIGSQTSDNTDNIYITYMLAGNNYIGINQFGDNVGGAIANSLGFMMLVRNNSTTFNRWFNNSKTIISSNSTNTSTNQITIGAFNRGSSITNFSTKQIAFTTIGSGLTDTEASALYTAVQAFQTTLGRQV